MDIFDFLTLIGGLSLFLFGMNVMGQALERRAGSGLRTLLGRLTTGKLIGLLTGIGVTAVIQSSSATTVMVVGFVNSGIMSLRQAINVIMGANIGTTVTAWILSLGGIESGNIFVKLLKPESFTPVLALVGIVLSMFCSEAKKKDTGTILLGFATLMFGMETMSDAVSGLADVPAFQEVFLLFDNPIFGVLAGALLTAVLQSSSASVGILQALAVTGQVTFGAAVPIIMGQNIGTCITALLSSIGANKNAKRAALVHLSFNVIGTVTWLIVFWAVKEIFEPALLSVAANRAGIAVAHSAFNILCTMLLLPMSGLLERLVIRLVPDDAAVMDANEELDERLLATPPLALERCSNIAVEMAKLSFDSLRQSMDGLLAHNAEAAARIRTAENLTDHYEDALGTYLVKLSGRQISARDSAEAAKLLRMIGDFERISDHAVNLVESSEELLGYEYGLSAAARRELGIITNAVGELLDLTERAVLENDMQSASAVEPLEQVVDELKERLRVNHISRMQQGECSIELGFVWSDMLTNLERSADHCSNIAACVIDMAANNMNLHESVRAMRTGDPEYERLHAEYAAKYSV